MVDRCFALWQTINPNSYVQPSNMYSGSFTLPQGQLVNIDTRKQSLNRLAVSC